MAIDNLSESYSAAVELLAQENSLISTVTNGLYQPDATNSSVIHTVSYGAPVIGDYVKGTPITYSGLDDVQLDIPLSTQKYFAFSVEDIDEAQTVNAIENPNVIQHAKGLAIEADKMAFGLFASAGTTIDDGTYAGTAGNPYSVSASNIDDVVGDAGVVLDEKNASTERVLIVSPKVFKLILDDSRATLTDNVGVFATGYVKDYYGFEVYKSNSLSGTSPQSDCIAMTKRAMPFASSVTEFEKIRLEAQFASANRGLYVFGAAVKFADEMIHLNLTV